MPAEEHHPQYSLPNADHVTNNGTRSCGPVNKRHLPIKVFYFLIMSAMGDLLPFLALHFKARGLTPNENAIIYGIMPFVGFLMRPVVGAVADKSKQHKGVLIIMTLLTGLFHFLLVFVPVREMPAQEVIMATTVICNSKTIFLQGCPDSTMEASNIVGAKSCELSCEKKNDIIDVNQMDNTSLPNIFPYNFSIVEDDYVTLPFFAEEFQNLSACHNFDLKDILMLNKNSSSDSFCQQETSVPCNIHCTPQDKGSSENLMFDETFLYSFFIFLMAMICFAPIFPIMDAAAYDILGKDNQHLWGKQRLWGQVGFIIWAFSATVLLEYLEVVQYNVLFYLHLPLTVISAISAGFLDVSSNIVCWEFARNVGKLLCNGRVVCFLSVIMYFGMMLGALDAFGFWYLETIGAPKILFGLQMLTGILFEVPILYKAGTLIKKLGHVGSFSIALFCYSLKLLVYSLIQNPWFVLLVEPTSAVTAGFMYAATTVWANQIAPPGMAATVQGLVAGLQFGFGKGIGSYLTGKLIGLLGFRWTWGVYSITSIVVLVMFVFTNRCVFKSSPGLDLAEDTAVQDDVLMNAHDPPSERKDKADV